jgi:putative membrane protein
MPSPENFDYPLLNACLNGISFVLLLIGYGMIRSGQKKAHIACMASALVTSTLFLTSYVTYHYLTEGVVSKFPTEYPTVRRWYFAILLSHIPLAALLVPLVLMTVIPALRKRFDKHKRWAKITLPIWLYVSVTGVLIYLMLYRWYLPSSVENPPQGSPASAVENRASDVASGDEDIPNGLSYSPEMFTIHAKPEEDVVTARFEVKNSTDKAVRIVSLDTTCHCLDVRAESELIAAGAMVVVEADFALEKLVGTSEKYVIIRTDDPENAEIRLGVQVTVDATYSIEPLTLDWKVGEEPEPKAIVFKVLRDEPIRITGIEHSRESVFTAAIREIEEGREYRIVLTPNSTEKELLGFVRVTTDCEIEKYARELMYFKISRNE